LVEPGRARAAISPSEDGPPRCTRGPPRRRAQAVPGREGGRRAGAWSVQRAPRTCAAARCGPSRWTTPCPLLQCPGGCPPWRPRSRPWPAHSRVQALLQCAAGPRPWRGGVRLGPGLQARAGVCSLQARAGDRAGPGTRPTRPAAATGAGEERGTRPARRAGARHPPRGAALGPVRYQASTPRSAAACASRSRRAQAVRPPPAATQVSGTNTPIYRYMTSRYTCAQYMTRQVYTHRRR
jgi:hypothetical protein